MSAGKGRGRLGAFKNDCSVLRYWPWEWEAGQQVVGTAVGLWVLDGLRCRNYRFMLMEPHSYVTNLSKGLWPV